MTDLCKIQSGLKDLGHIMFGQSSPIKDFQVKLSANKEFQRRGTQRTRTSSTNSLTSRTLRTDSYVPKEPEEPHWKQVSKESAPKGEPRVAEEEDVEEEGTERKKTSLHDLIPKVSIFKGRGKEKLKKDEKEGVQLNRFLYAIPGGVLADLLLSFPSCFLRSLFFFPFPMTSFHPTVSLFLSSRLMLPGSIISSFFPIRLGRNDSPGSIPPKS